MNITTPTGRYINGPLWEAVQSTFEGQPTVIGNGPNKGKPKIEYYVQLAVPKESPEWPFYRAAVDAFAQKEFPHLYKEGVIILPSFAFKIADGDLTAIDPETGEIKEPSSARAGCWILTFTRSASLGAPAIVQTVDGALKHLSDPESVYPGCYVRLAATMSPNTGSKPGLFTGLDGLELVLAGPALSKRVDLSKAFASTAYVPDVFTVGDDAPSPTARPAPPAVPNPAAAGFVPAPIMSDKANGATYESFIESGWTKEAMIAEGYLIA